MLALLMLVTLTACGGSETRTAIYTAPPPVVKVVKVPIPDLSPADKKPCYDPGVPAGVDARVILADTRVALADCRNRHQRVVRQHADARKL